MAGTSNDNDRYLTFSRNELMLFLQRDIVPTKLQDTWNALAVNWQQNYLFVSPFASIKRGEYSERLFTSDGARIFRGHDTEKHRWNSIAEGQDYFRVLSGYKYSPQEKLLTFELGTGVAREIEPSFGAAMSRALTAAMSRVAAPGHKSFEVPTGRVTEPWQAVQLWVDYTDPKAMPVIFNFEHYLCVTNPQTKEEARQALLILGETMRDIESGRKVDFNALRTRLIDCAGLQPTQPLAAPAQYPIPGLKI